MNGYLDLKQLCLQIQVLSLKKRHFNLNISGLQKNNNRSEDDKHIWGFLALIFGLLAFSQTGQAISTCQLGLY